VGQGGGDEAYYAYVEEADDDANKVSRRNKRVLDIYGWTKINQKTKRHFPSSAGEKI
jgi:hypothetical protein